MQHATEQSVLGDFNDARFDYYGVPSRFFRKDGRLFVETDGPDGKLATFEVKYTFGVDPLQHFREFGWREGRNPSSRFDTEGYLAHYDDVAAAGVNPLEHYMQFGWKEGRDPSTVFDTLGYLAANPDVAAAGINPLEH